MSATGGRSPDSQLDPDRQQLARRYARLRRRLWALEFLAGALYLLVWLLSGLNQALHQSLMQYAFPWWIQLLLTALALGLPWVILTLPLTYYRGFYLPRKFDLSTQKQREWWSDLAKQSLISLLLGAPLLIGLFVFIRLSPQDWWFWAAAAYSLFTVVLAMLAPVLLMPIFFKLSPLGNEYQELRQRLIALAESAGTRVEGVFSFDMSRRTRTANAALAGIGRTRRILLGDTLLHEFSADEIETVMAHELAHHVHGDIPLLILTQSGFHFLAFWLVSIGLQIAQTRGLIQAVSDPAGLPLLSLLLGALGFLSMPFANAFSRWRETLADRYAIQVTGMPEAFANAMTRLANQNLADINPERWVVLLLYSHPPLSERIALAHRISNDLRQRPSS